MTFNLVPILAIGNGVVTCRAGGPQKPSARPGALHPIIMMSNDQSCLVWGACAQIQVKAVPWIVVGCTASWSWSWIIGWVVAMDPDGSSNSESAGIRIPRRISTNVGIVLSLASSIKRPCILSIDRAPRAEKVGGMEEMKAQSISGTTITNCVVAIMILVVVSSRDSANHCQP